MTFGKKITPGAFVRATIIMLCILCGFTFKAQAQADDLMIVEYVDWSSGAGVAVKIYNPTATAKTLSNYKLKIFGNGSTTSTTDVNLKGTLAPNSSIIIGNDDYISDCPSVSQANFDNFTPGVNGDDVVALTTSSGSFVDMIGRVGFSAGNTNSQKVGTVSDALYQRKLVRQVTNLSRYSLSSGTYNATNFCSANIWPNNSSTSVLGWTVSSATCLTTGNWTLPALTITGLDQTLKCKTTGAINLSATSTPPVTTAGITVQWSGGKGTFNNANIANPTYTPGPQDFYRIKLKVTLSLCGRQVSDDVIITNGDSTERSSGFTFAPQNPLINEPVTFTIQNKTPNQTTGTWNFGDGTQVTKVANPTQHTYTTPGTYQVNLTAFNKDGCEDTFTQTITVGLVNTEVKIPNIFTPNGDKINDTYKPQLPPTTSYEIQVFNRWGVQVFESSDISKPWAGEKATDGVYFVHIKATYFNGEKLDVKLPVTIVR
jgi:gliding motility-associated-like protein